MPTQHITSDPAQPRQGRRGPSASSGRSLKYALLGAALAAALAFTVLAPALETADAAKGGNGGGGKKGGGGGGGTTWTGSFSVSQHVDADGDGVISHGDVLFFAGTSNASRYYVTLTCLTAAGATFTQTAGLYAGWPFPTNYDLFHFSIWPGGGATCTAVFWGSNSDGTNQQNIGSPMTLTVVS